MVTKKKPTKYKYVYPPSGIVHVGSDWGDTDSFLRRAMCGTFLRSLSIVNSDAEVTCKTCIKSVKATVGA